MEDNNSQSHAEETPIESATKTKYSNRDIVLAIIQHGNRSIAILLIFSVVLVGVIIKREALSKWLTTAQSLKFGSFEYKARDQAVQEGLGIEFRQLVDLTDEQIELFLIVGKQRSENYSYTSGEVTETNLNKLQDIGLLTNVQVLPNNHFNWAPTEKGIRLHKILFQWVTKAFHNVNNCENAPLQP